MFGVNAVVGVNRDAAEGWCFVSFGGACLSLQCGAKLLSGDSGRISAKLSTGLSGLGLTYCLEHGKRDGGAGQGSCEFSHLSVVVPIDQLLGDAFFRNNIRDAFPKFTQNYCVT